MPQQHQQEILETESQEMRGQEQFHIFHERDFQTAMLFPLHVSLHFGSKCNLPTSALVHKNLLRIPKCCVQLMLWPCKVSISLLLFLLLIYTDTRRANYLLCRKHACVCLEYSVLKRIMYKA